MNFAATPFSFRLDGQTDQVARDDRIFLGDASGTNLASGF
jgi:hypothetical protein